MAPWTRYQWSTGSAAPESYPRVPLFSLLPMTDEHATSQLPARCHVMSSLLCPPTLPQNDKPKSTFYLKLLFAMVFVSLHLDSMVQLMFSYTLFCFLLMLEVQKKWEARVDHSKLRVHKGGWDRKSSISCWQTTQSIVQEMMPETHCRVSSFVHDKS